MKNEAGAGGGKSDGKKAEAARGWFRLAIAVSILIGGLAAVVALRPGAVSDTGPEHPADPDVARPQDAGPRTGAPPRAASLTSRRAEGRTEESAGRSAPPPGETEPRRTPASDYIGFTSMRIDTSTTPWATAEEIRSQRLDDGTCVAIVQFDTITNERADALRTAGASRMIPKNQMAYLVTIPPDSYDSVVAVPGVKWVGALPPAAKTIRSVLDSRENPLELEVACLEDPARALAGLDITVESTYVTRRGQHISRIDIAPDRLDAVLALPSVLAVLPAAVSVPEGERAAQIAAGNYPAGGTEPTGPGYASWLASNGLTGGAGFVVHVMDDGLDQGDATNLPGTAHQDIAGRIAGIKNATGDPLGDSERGHGQLIAGIIAGNATTGTTDSDGFLLGQGMAPQAHVYATKFHKNSGGMELVGETFDSLIRNAQDQGALFTNYSLGFQGLNGLYDIRASEFDGFIRDADDSEAGNQQMTVFFSAGNEGWNGSPGGTAETITPPGTAKNGITVGAGENTDADGSDTGRSGPTQADSLRDLWGDSSKGPNADGRLGITLIATGTHVQGPTSSHAAYTAAGVAHPVWPTPQPTPPCDSCYTRSTGTSFANAVACGAGIITHEVALSLAGSNGFPSVPSPALIKAMLIATATDMAGGSDGNGGVLDHIPSFLQGWGSVNLSTLTANKGLLYAHDQATLFTGSAQTFQLGFEVIDPGKPFKAVLVWTDAPVVFLQNPALANDLDLLVTSGSTMYQGNVFSGGFSTTGGSADRLNNVEVVSIPDPSGAYDVRVDSFAISHDGVPGNASAMDQDFALLVFNGTAIGGPAPPPCAPDTLLRELERPAPAAGDQFGFAVAVSGRRAVVGAKTADPGGIADAGAAWVFDTETGAVIATLNNPAPAAGDQFGASVAISGNLAVVGADMDDPGGLANAGTAYIFNVASGPAPTPLATLNHPAPGAGDLFGFSVAISGLHVVVGAQMDNALGGFARAGSAHSYNASNGTHQFTFLNPAPATDDRFGISVGASGNLAVIGAALDDPGGLADAGAAWVFDLTTGAMVATLNNPTPAASDRFGLAVAISGNLAVVGAEMDDSGGLANEGAAYVFDVTTGALLLTLNNPAPAAQDRFGETVAIHGDTIVVGAMRDNLPSGTVLDAGTVYVFDAATGAHTATLDNPMPAANDQFGSSVAVFGNVAVAGANQDDPGGLGNAGTAWVFTCSSLIPTPTGTPTPTAGVTPSPTMTQSATPTATPSPPPVVFTNPSPVAVPSVGPAAVYPAILNVSGLSGAVERVTIELLGIEHTLPDDLDILVRAPNGSGSVILVSDCGGAVPVSGVSLTLDHGAPALPDGAALTSGTWGTTDYAAGDDFPAPGPGTTYGSDLSVYNVPDATALNGDWELYVVDDSAGDAGLLAGGWRVNVFLSSGSGVTPTPTATPCCPGDADNSGGAVNANDFLAVQANFGVNNGVGGHGDADCSGGSVNANDFLAVQANFGLNCG